MIRRGEGVASGAEGSKHDLDGCNVFADATLGLCVHFTGDRYEAFIEVGG
jgi:hypothetical protein